MISLAKRAAVAIATPALIFTVLPEAVSAAVFRLQEATVSEINNAFDADALTSEALIQLYLNRIETYPKTLAEIIEVAEQDDFFETYSTRLDLFRVEQESVPLTDPDYIDALTNGRALIRNSALSLLESNNLDALIYPTSGCPASPLPGLEDPAYICESGPFPSNIANISGFPDVQVPAGFTSDQLPVSLSFFGKAYSEPTLLGLAYAFEQTTQARMSPLLFPALPGEEIEYESVPEPGMIPALAILGTGVLGIRLVNRRRQFAKATLQQFKLIEAGE